MSHVERIEGEYLSLDALMATAQALGGIFHVGAKTHRYYGGSQAKCDHKVSFVDTEYEVGIVQQTDGSFAVQFDSWSTGKLGQKLGPRGERWRQRYNVEAVKPQLAREGYAFTEEVVDGVLTLTAQRAQSRASY